LVWQWCSDWQSVDYGSAPAVDPQGCTQKESKYGMMKVCRGSSYEDGNGKVPRDAFRGALQIGHFPDWYFGMRVLMEAPER
jgi:formylglycine-generating enzyme required for sulfatase activity